MATNGRARNGSGTIYKAKNGKWFAEVQWTTRQGEKKVKKFSSNKKSVVSNKLDEFIKQLAVAEGDTNRGDVLFEDYCRHWMSDVQRYKLKPSSYDRKEVTLKNQVYPHLGTIPIQNITFTDVQDMITSLNKTGLAFSTIKKAYDVVNECLRNYRIQTHATYNPCEGVSLPTNKQKNISNIKYFNEEQRKAIIQEATKTYLNGKNVYRLGCAIIALMYTGMRIGELLALNWTDINFDQNTISITKNAVLVKDRDDEDEEVYHYQLLTQDSAKTYSSARVIPMTDKARLAFEELKKINGDKEYVMSTSGNSQMAHHNINHMFHRILINSGVARNKDECCGVHSLRHTFASMLFKNGCEVKVVSELLGHSSTKITENIYIHLIQEQKVKAIQDIDNFSD